MIIDSVEKLYLFVTSFSLELLISDYGYQRIDSGREMVTNNTNTIEERDRQPWGRHLTVEYGVNPNVSFSPRFLHNPKDLYDLALRANLIEPGSDYSRQLADKYGILVGPYAR